MSLWLEREAGKFTKAQDKGKAAAAKMLVAASKAWREAYGSLPESVDTQKRSPQIRKESVVKLDLQAEWGSQSQKYVDLGFHTEIGLSQEDYLASLPKFEPQPEVFVGRFDIPVLVETRITPQRQAELAGLPYYLEGLNVRDWEDDPKGHKTPDTAYATWMQDGKKNLNKCVRDIRNSLAEDERGATVYDGIALWVANPSMFDHYIDFPGTSVGSASAPSLYGWGGKPEVDYRHVDDAAPRFGSASCGRIVAA